MRLKQHNDDSLKQLEGQQALKWPENTQILELDYYVNFAPGTAESVFFLPCWLFLSLSLAC